MHDSLEVQETSLPSSVQPVGNLYGAQNIGGNARVVNGDIQIIKNVYRNPVNNETNLRNAVLDWLSPITFRQIHEEIRNRVVQQDASSQARSAGDYSGKWLLESDVFDEWRSRKIRKLWYHGMPGAGKTVLASTIIDHLLKLAESLPERNSFSVAYLYLSYREIHSVNDLLGSIIRQMVQDDNKLPDDLIKTYQRHVNRGNEPPSHLDLSVMLAQLVQRKPLYIIVDGLDECPRETRQLLIQLLQPNSFQDLKLNLLVASRLLDEFETLARGFERINIQADFRDIDLFIDREFDRDAYLQEFSEQDPTLRDDVKKAIRLKCEGMFLLATIHVHSLTSKLNLAEIRQCLQDLPSDIDSTYDLAIQRILSQREERKKLALETFAWILHSQDTMSLRELQHALAIDPTTRIFDPERIHQESRIRDVCGGLVSVTNGGVRFVHFTAQTYFSNHCEELLSDIHTLIAETCANYLCIPSLEDEAHIAESDNVPKELQSTIKPPSPRPKSNQLAAKKKVTRSRTPSPIPSRKTPSLTFASKLENFPLVQFAARNLGYHLRRIPDSESHAQLLEILESLTLKPAKRSFLCSLYMSMRLYVATPDQRVGDLELYSAHSNIRDPDQKTDSGQGRDKHQVSTVAADKINIPASQREITPLHIAAYLGWLPLVKALMSKGCDLNAIDPYGRSPFVVALQQGHLDVTGALMEKGANLNLSRPIGQDILLQVAQEGHVDVVTATLAQILKRFEIRDASLRSKAITNEQNLLEFLIKLLLQLIWIILNTQSKPSLDGSSPINQVYQPTPQDVKRAILALGDDNLGILAAAGFGDADMVQELLTKEYTSDAQPVSPYTIKTALFLAVESGFVAAAEVMLANGADIDYKDSHSNTVLHRAALRNDIKMVEMLLTYNPDIDAKNDKGRSPWSMINEGAATKNFTARRQVLDALTQAGADPNARDSLGVSVLYGAAAGGHVEVVRYLLEVGVDPSSQTIFSWAPLHWAAADGHLEVVRLLIKAGADVSPLSDTSKTPLDLARTHKDNPNRDLTVKALVEAGAKTAKEILDARATRKSQNTQKLIKSTDQTTKKQGAPKAQKNQPRKDVKAITGTSTSDKGNQPAGVQQVEEAWQHIEGKEIDSHDEEDDD